MVEPVAMAVFRHVAVDEPDFVSVDRRIALRDRAFALAKRLHLGAGELDSCLEPLLDEIVETGAPVFGHDLLLVEGLRKRLGHWRLRSAPHAQALHRPRASMLPKLRPAEGGGRTGSYCAAARAHIWWVPARHR